MASTPSFLSTSPSTPSSCAYPSSRADLPEEIGFQQIRDAFAPRFKHFRLLTNLVIPMPGAHVPTAELDAVVICEAGVFIFEIKGHRNCLIERDDGNDHGLKRWFTVSDRDGARNEMADPLRQNAPKRERLRELVAAPIKLHHYVLFPMPDVRLEPTMHASVLTASDVFYLGRMLRSNSKSIRTWSLLDEAGVRQTEAMLRALQGTLTAEMHIDNCKAIFGEGPRCVRLPAGRAVAGNPPRSDRIEPASPGTDSGLPAPVHIPASAAACVSACARALKWLVIALGAVLAGWLAWDGLAQSHLCSSAPLGRLHHIGPGGIDAAAVLETARGFYPILASAAFEKGADLVMETRGNGQRFVCDAGRTTCVAAALDTLPATRLGD